MTKVVKLQLISKNDEIIDYKSVNKILWDLQYETRIAANKAVQLSWEFWGFESEYKKKFGDYPTKEQKVEIMGYPALSSYIYSELSKATEKMNTGNLSALLQNVSKKLSKEKSEIFRGEKSIPSFRSGMPIDLSAKNISLGFTTEENDSKPKDWIVTLSLLSNKYKKELGLAQGRLDFKTITPGKSARSVRTILERCYDGVYKISGSKLVYAHKKWFLMLSYSFDKPINDVAEKYNSDSIMGVHIAKGNAVTVAFSDSDRVLNIDGGEVESFAIQINRRKRNIQSATKNYSMLCGGGRVGHGYKTKLKPLEHISETISNFRNTTNHKYSRQIVNWAIQNKCGVIQIEDLKGCSTENLEKNTLLKDWSHYDLISKTVYKAKEVGIKVVKVNYKTLRTWCDDCKDFCCKMSDDIYVCEKCGQVKEFDDIALAKLLTVKDIDKLSGKQTDEEDSNEE